MFEVFDNFSAGIHFALLHSLYIMHDDNWYEEKTKMEYVIWCISKGNVYITVNKKQFIAKEGDVVFFMPGTRYTAKSDNAGCEFLYQKYIIEFGNNINILSETNLSGVLSNPDISVLQSKYVDGILSLRNKVYSLNAYSLFLMFFSECIENIKGNGLELFNKNVPSMAHSDIWRVMSYMGEYYYNNLDIAKLSNMAHLSEKHFIHQFKNTVGISPKQYIIQCRMRKASDMLINSDANISEIARIVGYNDIYTFSKAFKKYHDISPTEYRHNFLM
ncbi:MAG: helix-turn-helix transcriptional regulator [Clostridia bacterium]|nr:helix-turn-helix transcriptional regulator [Clostridia bacterium]